MSEENLIFERFEQVDLAKATIMAIEFDHFDSQSKAIAHAAFEGIDPELIEHGVGYKQTYSKVPRRYPEDLEDRLFKAFELMDADQPAEFIYSNNYFARAGNPSPEAADDSTTVISVKVADDLRSSHVRVAGYDIFTTNFIPHTNTVRVLPHIETQLPVDLKLGRNIITAEDDPWLETAVYDTWRPWESILVVGEKACIAYIGKVREAQSRIANRTSGKNRSYGIINNYLESQFYPLRPISSEARADRDLR